jgi:hypothetical protein
MGLSDVIARDAIGVKPKLRLKVAQVSCSYTCEKSTAVEKVSSMQRRFLLRL